MSTQVPDQRPSSGAPVPRPRSRVPAAVRAMRPRQWLKNVLVAAAPVAAGRILEPAILLATALAILAFCLVSSAVYLMNDLRDAPEDRIHPVKRSRPIAAGEVSPAAAIVLLALVGAGGLALGWAVSPGLFVVLVVYIVLQVGYTLALKHRPVVDLAVVALGFLLRAMAGGYASGIPLTQWFLLVAFFGSFFMVAGKRFSEMQTLGADAGTRSSLSGYTPSFLRFLWTLSATMVVASYSLWAFDHASGLWLGVPWAAISIAPFTLGIIDYARVIDAGAADEPEAVVLSDRVLQGLGLLWVATILPALLA